MRAPPQICMEIQGLARITRASLLHKTAYFGQEPSIIAATSAADLPPT